MAYEDLTPERFKELKPQFEEVDDAIVQNYIDLGSLWMDKSWPAKIYEAAWVAITCHLMTLDGLGTDAQSNSFRTGAANYQSVRSGELALTRYQKAAGEMTYIDWLSQTACGQMFALFLKRAKAGPRVAMGGIRGQRSAYAKDWPLGTGGWPSWWWSGQ